jgi:hypothetical protein
MILAFGFSLLLVSLLVLPYYCLSAESFPTLNPYSKDANHSHNYPFPLKGKSSHSSHHSCCNLIMQHTPSYLVALSFFWFTHEETFSPSLELVDSVYRPPEFRI